MVIGEQYQVPQGNNLTVFAYSGDTSGSITFTLAFTAAQILEVVSKSSIIIASVAMGVYLS